jgi:hypothetical protein
MLSIGRSLAFLHMRHGPVTKMQPLPVGSAGVFTLSSKEREAFGLKGQCHEIFYTQFFHQSAPSGPIRGVLPTGEGFGVRPN